VRQWFRGVEYVMLIQRTENSVRLYLFPYFLENQAALILTFNSV